ncbi:MAG TPA: hypothetical protein P5531_06585 [Bacteroidales bacterium]|nr:hypothetical protein [Bacteroidales bacterium]HSA43696.1 hypothetical protein [Bacteroidales bacterium]
MPKEAGGMFPSLLLIFLMSIVILSLVSCRPDNAVTKLDPGYPSDSLPEIHPWMIKPDGSGPAMWLDRKQSDGRYIREPINMVIVDRMAGSREDAVNRLTEAMTRAGFAPRFGHSGGYLGMIGGRRYPQQPDQPDYAFSDCMWAFPNNHCRLFGPAFYMGAWIWTGSCSREKGISHDYVSFMVSREKLADALVRYANATRAGNMNLGNRMDDATAGTGDHDGFAALLILHGTR